MVYGEEQLFGKRVVLLLFLCDCSGIELLYRIRLTGKNETLVIIEVLVILPVCDVTSSALRCFCPSFSWTGIGIELSILKPVILSSMLLGRFMNWIVSNLLIASVKYIKKKAE